MNEKRAWMRKSPDVWQPAQDRFMLPSSLSETFGNCIENNGKMINTLILNWLNAGLLMVTKTKNYIYI